MGAELFRISMTACKWAWASHSAGSAQIECQYGKPVLAPVDDPAGLDVRRKELFRLPIGEYLKVAYLARFCAKVGK